MAELITVPTFTFNQGKLGDTEFEKPISVDFYNGSICLRQDGEYDVQENIILHPDFVEKLFKEIKKHLPQAKAMLDR